MTANPNRANFTVGSIKAWVPTRMSTSPDSSASNTSRLAAPLTDPVNNSTLTFMSPNNSLNPCRCCCAKISVGAMMAA